MLDPGAGEWMGCSDDDDDDEEKRTVKGRTRSYNQRTIKHRRTTTRPLYNPSPSRIAPAPHPPAQKPPLGRPSTRHLRALCKVTRPGAPSGAAGGADRGGDIGERIWAVGSSGESVGKKGRGGEGWAGGEQGEGEGCDGKESGEGFSSEGVARWKGGGGVNESCGDVGAQGTIGPRKVCVACADKGTEMATRGVGSFSGREARASQGATTATGGTGSLCRRTTGETKDISETAGSIRLFRRRTTGACKSPSAVSRRVRPFS